jgi:hypothetical protein
MTTTQTPDVDTELAEAERLLAVARNKKAIASVAAAEAARLADPFEVAIDAAEAALATAKTRVLTMVKVAASASTVLRQATEAQRALSEALAAGDAPDDQALLDALEARRVAAERYAFYEDAQKIALANVELATSFASGQRDARRKRDLLALQEGLSADFRALVPNQPDDATLKAELARNPGLLSTLIRETSDAYNAAYHYWRGNPAQPVQSPRQRLILERGDLGHWMAWAVAPEEDLPMGWQDRATIRQIRACIAARDHFTKYTKLDLDALMLLHTENYTTARAKLPRWNRITAPGTNEPMIAPGVFAPVNA